MQQSASDSVLRALIMGGLVGGMVWAAGHYPTLPRWLIQRAISWYDTAGTTSSAARQSELAAADSFQAAGAPRLFPEPLAAAQPLNSTPSPGALLPGLPSPAIPSYVTTANWNETAGSVSPAVRWAAPQGDAPGNSTQVDRREQIEQRLQALGAVYTLLEMWGRDQRRYRFHCQVAFAGGANETRSFEANGELPLQAMERVLRDVEAWRVHAGPAEQPAQ